MPTLFQPLFLPVANARLEININSLHTGYFSMIEINFFKNNLPETRQGVMVWIIMSVLILGPHCFQRLSQTTKVAASKEKHEQCPLRTLNGSSYPLFLLLIKGYINFVSKSSACTPVCASVRHVQVL